MPSPRDYSTAVVFDVMSMFKPVVAAAWRGALACFNDNCRILIWPTGRTALVKGLAAAMARLARSPDERAWMGHAASARVVAHYAWKVKTEDILQIYQRVPDAAAPARYPALAA